LGLIGLAQAGLLGGVNMQIDFPFAAIPVLVPRVSTQNLQVRLSFFC
jgi:hypothetical protein